MGICRRENIVRAGVFLTVLLAIFCCNRVDAQTWIQVNEDGFSDPNNTSLSATIIFNDNLYGATRNLETGIEIWRYDGSSWMQVNEDGFGDPNNIFCRMQIYQGHLYVCTHNSETGTEIWKYNGSSWTQINEDGFGDSNNSSVGSGSGIGPATGIFNNNLYLGTSNAETGTEIWRYDGSSWTQINEDGFGDSNNSLGMLMTVFNENLYLGTSNQSTGTEIWRYDGSSWTQINEDGFGNLRNSYATLPIFDGKLYANTMNYITGAELWRYDGSSWTQINEGGWGNSNNVGIAGPEILNSIWYAASCNMITGTQIWEYDGSSWTQINEDGFGDVSNVSSGMFSFNGGLYVIPVHEYFAKGTQIWKYDGSSWTQVNEDGFGDSNNVGCGNFDFNYELYIETSNYVTGCEVWKMASAPVPTLHPVPDIMVNGSDGVVDVHRSDSLRITLSMDNQMQADEADWWLAAQYGPSSLLFFTPSGWTNSWVPVYQGPLFNFPPIDLLTIPTSDLPTGSYWFYFAVDTNRDGDITLDSLYLDAVGVNLTE